MIRHSDSTSESWKNLPWKKFQKTLFRLQKRIFKAVREGNIAKARSLQKLILRSKAAKFLAIRQVTQLNTGKRTAGVDGKTALTFKERFELFEILSNAHDWKHKGLKEFSIPKKNGKIRTLKVPTIADRVWQCLIKFALEAAHEATFHARSYGFRTGRSAHDAQKVIFNNLNSHAKGYTKKVIELDIKKCFDRISHESIMKNLIAPTAIKKGIFRCLKSGVNPEFPEQGTPQGGVVSPLLANIALNGIESIHNCVRYADDMLIFVKQNEDPNSIIRAIAKFLADRGMEISEEKTKITATTNGFNFLGWKFIVQTNNHKLRGTPSKENYLEMRKKVKNIVNSSNYGAEKKAKMVAPIVRGWRNYHRHCQMKGASFSLWGLNHSAFKAFCKDKNMTAKRATELIKTAFPTVPTAENKFVNVKQDKSPYDGDLTYWAKRESKLYSGKTATLLKKQNHSCERCGHLFMPGDTVELHHKDGNHSNWKTSNLAVLHRSCHQYEHMSRAKAQDI